MLDMNKATMAILRICFKPSQSFICCGSFYRLDMSAYSFKKDSKG